MRDVEQPGAAPGVETADAPAPRTDRKPWVGPRIGAYDVDDQTQGNAGGGSDASSCLS
jgi:hypothetical protein